MSLNCGLYGMLHVFILRGRELRSFRQVTFFSCCAFTCLISELFLARCRCTLSQSSLMSVLCHTLCCSRETRASILSCVSLTQPGTMVSYRQAVLSSACQQGRLHLLHALGVRRSGQIQSRDAHRDLSLAQQAWPTVIHRPAESGFGLLRLRLSSEASQLRSSQIERSVYACLVEILPRRKLTPSGDLPGRCLPDPAAQAQTPGSFTFVNTQTQTYMHAHMHAYINACIHSMYINDSHVHNTYLRTHVQTYIDTYLYIYIYMRLFFDIEITDNYVCICYFVLHIHMRFFHCGSAEPHACMYMYMYMYTYRNVHIHVPIHIYIYIYRKGQLVSETVAAALRVTRGWRRVEHKWKSSGVYWHSRAGTCQPAFCLLIDGSGPCCR